MGLMSVKFNSTMRTEGVNLTHINSTIIDLYIIPEQDRHLEEGFNITTLNLTWQATDFKNDTLQIQLYFNNPSVISPLPIPDRIALSLKDPEYANYFMSKKLLKPLHQDWWTISRTIKKQMAPSDFNKAYQDGADNLNDLMTGLMVFSILLYLMTQGGQAMRHMFIKVRAL